MVEDVLSACIKRLEFYQVSRFKCQANDLAIRDIAAALYILNQRTMEREQKGVEGLNKE